MRADSFINLTNLVAVSVKERLIFSLLLTQSRHMILVIICMDHLYDIIIFFLLF